MNPNLFYYHNLLPDTPWKTVEAMTNFDDQALIERIIKAYQSSINDISDLGGPIWTSISEKSKDIHELLLAGDVNKVADVLRYPANSNLLYGFENVFQEYAQQARENPKIGELQARWAHDNLVRVAETIGAIRTYLPEVDFQEKNWAPDNLLESIEECIGFVLNFPNIIPEQNGIKSCRGVINHRAVQAFYQAWRIHQLQSFVNKDRVLEIGAGLGRTAWFASLFGITDYTIIDLPMANVAQAYFLGRTLGPEKILLHGEYDDASSRIRIENTSWFHTVNNHYDIALNNDSMVEIGIEAVDEYWKQLVNRVDIFVSMNHEAQEFRVADIPSRIGVPCKKIRSFHPIRKGYIEEIFFLGKQF